MAILEKKKWSWKEFYTALVKVGFCNLKWVCKWFIGRNERWAVTEWYNVRTCTPPLGSRAPLVILSYWYQLKAQHRSITEFAMGWRSTSIGTASDSRSKGPVRIPSRKKWVFRVKNAVFSLSVCPTHVCVYARTRMITHARHRSCSPCQSSKDYQNTKTPSMY